MQKVDLKKMVVAALFSALACVSTMVLHIHVPAPGVNGYIHPGDAMVILSGVILGPGYGGLAAGIGSALADLFTGHPVYIAPTFIIKFAVAVVSGLLYRRLVKNHKKRAWLAVLLAGVADMLLVAGGYFAYECLLYTFAGALAGVPANLVQGAAGLILAMLFYPMLTIIPEVRRLLEQNCRNK